MTYKSIINARMFMLATILFVASTHANAQTGVSHGQQTAAKKGSSAATSGGTTPVVGSGTAGQITRWTGFSGSTPAIGDSSISEDKFGQIGIGTTSPTSTLTVRGTIETTLGGFKFPDGTLQTTAGLSSVFRDVTLTGNGTAASPLGIANGGVGTNQLANNAVIASKIADGAVTGQKIAPSTVVRTLNGLSENVMLVAGSNIKITTVGSALTIATTTTDSEQNAYQAQVELDTKNGNASGQIPVPAGKRFVIEFVSFKAFSPEPFRLVILHTRVNGVPADFFLTPPREGEEVTAVVVRIYCDGNVGVEAAENSTASGSVRFALSGHLVDLP